MPGTGGHAPADGFKAGGVIASSELPGIALAALATLASGPSSGPEAPLIALGGGLAAWAVSRAKAASAPQVKIVIAAAGSFAAISTLLGSPLVGAFLLMEAAGLGGATLELVLLPGLLAAGVGALIFTGLGAWSGLGTFSLAIPGLPHFARPDVAEFGWALVIGLAAAALSVRSGATQRQLRGVSQRQRLLWTPVAGLVAAAAAVIFGEVTGKGADEVLFSGQTAIGPFITHAASYSVGALVLLVAMKGIGYSASPELLPRRAGLPGRLHRRGRRRCDVASAGPAARPGRRHGHGRHDSRDAQAPDDLGAARVACCSSPTASRSCRSSSSPWSPPMWP